MSNTIILDTDTISHQSFRLKPSADNKGILSHYIMEGIQRLRMLTQCFELVILLQFCKTAPFCTSSVQFLVPKNVETPRQPVSTQEKDPSCWRRSCWHVLCISSYTTSREIRYHTYWYRELLKCANNIIDIMRTFIIPSKPYLVSPALINPRGLKQARLHSNRCITSRNTSPIPRNLRCVSIVPITSKFNHT